MAETPLANSPEAREPDGTIKDNSPTTLTPETPSETTKETQPSTDTKAEVKDPLKPEAKPAGALEAYEFKLPEGLKLAEGSLEKITPIFKEAGLTQEVAQKLIDAHVEQIQALVKGPQEAYETLRTDWRNEVVKDPKLGDGTDLKPEVKATLGRAIDSIGGEAAAAFLKAMELTGAGDNPAVIRGLYAMAQLISEGRPVKAGGPVSQPSPTAPNAAKAMYPNLP